MPERSERSRAPEIRTTFGEAGSQPPLPNDCAPPLSPRADPAIGRAPQLPPRLLNALAREVLPAVSRARGDPEQPPPATPPVVEDDVAELAQRAMSDEREAAGDHVQCFRHLGLAADDVFLNLLSPAARHMGELWDRDECSFVDVTLGVSRLQGILTALRQSTAIGVSAPVTRKRVLLLATPGEQHTLGLRMVAEFFRWDGWDVSDAFPRTRDELCRLAKVEWFDALGFSLGSETRADSLRRDIRAVRRASRNRVLAVLVGGPVLTANPEIAAGVEADGTARDARTAPLAARHCITVAAGGS